MVQSGQVSCQFRIAAGQEEWTVIDTARELVKRLKEPPPLPLDDDLRRELLEVLLVPPQQHEMTYEEFLAWADEDTLAEWVDGEVVMYGPASARHQDISGFLQSVLRSFVEVRGWVWCAVPLSR
ncbi:MAG: Uma2 family endonuclease [Anaerolineae bacterium]